MRYRYRNRYRNPARRLSGAVFLLILFFAFLFSRGGGGDFFLPILFVGLAFASLIGSVATLNPRGVYGGIQSFVWLLGLALCFLIGFWPWILLPIVASIVLGALFRPIMAGLLGLGVLGAANMMNRQSPMYQPPTQPYQQPMQPYQQPPEQPSYEPYQQGYQPPQGQQQPEIYQEGGQPHQYPSQSYEEPQAQYPQEMPPQQQ